MSNFLIYNKKPVLSDFLYEIWSFSKDFPFYFALIEHSVLKRNKCKASNYTAFNCKHWLKIKRKKDLRMDSRQKQWNKIKNLWPAKWFYKMNRKTYSTTEQN